ncbi:FAD-dependent oxidoreductase [Sinorhizobium meliloti]|uniref:oxidoreductase n=2 Tax=Rhizobium meliloti TaxID=382 RepID=UPI000418EB7E|nr:FAD-dependent oxidoreductase [Sinorhizobium meliloti]MDE3831433.1 FAD-dependent oxidoreductase [Sinorhizobium meliloti]MDE4579117.1 FAD-dependent oxidoreductase [Sinorhizobium meliloti]MDW9714100.1 NAD(P)-binding protein [Sinorhizobium meliloti]MDW9751232.1 NAD(P)-binding protein [Sinorhizobium meliloti]MDW9781890.1 NAD(P)-binding protein [Sinorhizobium meliloti]
MEEQNPAAAPAGRADPLLRPLQLGRLTLRNRIMSTSHETALDEGGHPLEAYQRYHEEKAKGGLALTMFGGSARISADTSWGGTQLDVSSDAVIPAFRTFSERIHGHGAALMCQISHFGRRANATVGAWLPALGPSHSREDYNRNFAHEMDRHDIARIVRDFGHAARRAREGGLDGIETMTGGHLIGQFLSPMVNRRSDEFGGSLENRMRVLRMVYEEIRSQVGADYPLGIRYTIDEDHKDGLSFAEAVTVANRLEREGLVDFFDCIFGRFDTRLNLLVYNIPDMTAASAPWLRQVGTFKAETSLPVFHAAKIADVATARYAIDAGLVDMVGMTRAHMADPQIVNKLRSGRQDQIRPCVGASHCLYRPVHCIHNPATGRETWLPQVIRRSPHAGRKAVVVGGGPAGLEAARVLAERGHHVVLLEAAGRLGGQLVLAAKARLRRDLIGIVDWRVAELERLGVDVRLNVYAEALDVLADAPDLVLVATGGIPDFGPVRGSELCLSVFDALGNPVQIADDVLIYDATGRHPAPSAAAEIAAAGKRVTFVARDPSIAPEMEHHSSITYRKAFAEHNVHVLLEHELVSVSAQDGRRLAVLRHLLTGRELSTTHSQIIVEHGTIPVNGLFDELRLLSVNDGATEIASLIGPAPLRERAPNGFELHRIGDAVSSRSVHAAMLDALRLGLQF